MSDNATKHVFSQNAPLLHTYIKQNYGMWISARISVVWNSSLKPVRKQFETIPKVVRNQSKSSLKPVHNDFKTIPEWLQHKSKSSLKPVQNNFKISPTPVKITPHRSETSPKWLQNKSKITPKQVQNQSILVQR